MKTLIGVCVLLFGVVAGAQEAKAPALDASTKELIASWAEAGAAQREVVQAHYTAMLATAEGKRYQDAVAAYNKRSQELNARVEQRVPGYVIDFANGGKLVPKPAK